jgi:hypothetical protein
MNEIEPVANDDKQKLVRELRLEEILDFLGLIKLLSRKMRSTSRI